jgi:hypothetical protein
LQISYAQHLAAKGAADAEHDHPGAVANGAKDSELPWGFGGNRLNMTMISGKFYANLVLYSLYYCISDALLTYCGGKAAQHDHDFRHKIRKVQFIVTF